MTLDTFGQLTIAAAAAVTVMLILWLVLLVTHDAGIVDVGWSGILGLTAIFYGVTQPVGSNRTWLVVLIASVWSFRLATYLLLNRVMGKVEDSRYRALRKRFAKHVTVFFFFFSQLQAFFAWLFSLAFWLAMQRQGPLDAFDFVGCLVWVAAVAGETISDLQLARFRDDQKNKGKTCRFGLWKYSRHPNYFFEWMHWWSYVIIAWKSPLGWYSLLAPAIMLLFLFKVTGIPTTEAQAVLSRGDDYRDYQRTTSIFFPWFPNREI